MAQINNHFVIFANREAVDQVINAPGNADCDMRAKEREDGRFVLEVYDEEGIFVFNL